MTSERAPGAPRHLPFDGRPHRLRMGLRPLEPSDWLEVDDGRDADLAEKRRLLRDHHGQVIATTEDPTGRIRSACVELLDRVRDDLHDRGLDTHPVGLEHLHPIDAAGRLTQEDWCVHLPDGRDGPWRLVAASVCFPTRWDLRRKIGGTIREIHAPVPLYDEQLADPMDRYFSRMVPEQGVWRLNWNLLDDPALHQPVRTRAAAREVRADTVGEQIWLRIERQTLVKLPVTGAIVFSIRIHQDPLGALRDDPEAMDRLARSLRAMPEPVWQDKGLASCGQQILDWLDTTAEQSRVGGIADR